MRDFAWKSNICNAFIFYLIRPFPRITMVIYEYEFYYIQTMRKLKKLSNSITGSPH